MAGNVSAWRRIADLRTREGLASFGKRLIAAFGENNLLTYASAIAYQVLFAVVPLALAGIALLGFLDLREAWETELAPRVREQVSPAAFDVIQTTIDRILTQRRTFWLTLGIGIALWEVSGAVRAVMGVLNRIYDVDDDRSFVERMGVSFVLAAVVALAVGVSIVALQFGDRVVAAVGEGPLVGVVGFVLRWTIAIAPLFLMIGLLVRFAPAEGARRGWLGLGAALAVVAWIGSSLVFGWYVGSVASYQSVFGSFAVVIVLMTYLYVSSLAFLVGIQIDAILRGVDEER